MRGLTHTRTWFFRGRIGVWAVLVLSLTCTTQAATAYTIQDLGTLGGVKSWAFGVNALGHVVGASNTANGELHAFFWDGAKMMDLGMPAGFNWALAVGINIKDQVVVNCSNTNIMRAFLWQNKQWIDLGTIYASQGTYAEGINDDGMVVGRAYHPQPPRAPYETGFVWKNGVMSDIGTLEAEGPSEAYAVNNLGQVVGKAAAALLGPQSIEHGIIWQGGVLTDGGYVDYFTGFYDINNAGQIAGKSTSKYNYPSGYIDTVFLRDNNGTTTVIDSYKPLALGDIDMPKVNNRAEVVYSRYDPNNPANTLVMYYQAGVKVNLSLMNFPNLNYLLSAGDINDSGQIAGGAMFTGAQGAHAYLLTPRKLAGDFNGDGKADILLRHPSSGEVFLWLMR